jgi:hypothetical protein
MNDNKGGPAFPCDRIGAGEIVSSAGMSMRDYFAAKAMQAWMTGWATDRPSMLQADVMADKAYEAADAMLKAREA